MEISVSTWFAPAVAAACIAGSPAVIPAVPDAHAQVHPPVQVHEVALTSEMVPADLLSALESLGSEQLPGDAVGDAVGFLGLDYLVASLMSAFNNVVSLVLTPISWIPFVGSLATSVIWMPINLVEQIIWFVFGSGTYYPYYPYYAEATDPGVPAELGSVSVPSDLGLPDTAPNIDVLGLDIHALGLDGTWNLGEFADAMQDVGAALLGLLP